MSRILKMSRAEKSSRPFRAFLLLAFAVACNFECSRLVGSIWPRLIIMSSTGKRRRRRLPPLVMPLSAMKSSCDGSTKDPMLQAVRDALIAFMAATAQAQAEASKEADQVSVSTVKIKSRGRALINKELFAPCCSCVASFPLPYATAAITS